MAKKHIKDIECYTIKFNEEDKNHEAMSDDSFYASRVAKELGVKLNTIEVKQILLLYYQKLYIILMSLLVIQLQLILFLFVRQPDKQE